MNCVLIRSSRVLAVLLVLTQAQFAPQALPLAQQAAVVLQQAAVLLDEPGRGLLLPLLLLQLARQLLSEPHKAAAAAVTHSFYTNPPEPTTPRLTQTDRFQGTMVTKLDSLPQDEVGDL